jgi:putative ABC transport system permease protein
MKNSSLDINNWSLLLAFALVLVSIFISRKEKLHLEKETLISVARAIIQLIIVGFVLKFVFNLNSVWVTLAMILVIIFNAALNGRKRSQGIENGFQISLTALLVSSAITIGLLLLTRVIKPEPYQLIPIAGMIVSNSMNATGLVFRSLHQMFTDQREQVFEKLALGADAKLASGNIIQESIRFGMQPTIDSVKTYGLVSLPGMMTGLIMAGVDPIYAIKYQIMVVFMLVSATSIASIIVSFMAYKKYFNSHLQLEIPTK